jgi:hypothetical protein
MGGSREAAAGSDFHAAGGVITTDAVIATCGVIPAKAGIQ